VFCAGAVVDGLVPGGAVLVAAAGGCFLLDAALVLVVALVLVLVAAGLGIFAVVAVGVGADTDLFPMTKPLVFFAACCCCSCCCCCFCCCILVALLFLLLLFIVCAALLNLVLAPALAAPILPGVVFAGVRVVVVPAVVSGFEGASCLDGTDGLGLVGFPLKAAAGTAAATATDGDASVVDIFDPRKAVEAIASDWKGSLPPLFAFMFAFVIRAVAGFVVAVFAVAGL